MRGPPSLTFSHTDLEMRSRTVGTEERRVGLRTEMSPKHAPFLMRDELSVRVWGFEKPIEMPIMRMEISHVNSKTCASGR